jgi:hypothetical protein
MDINPLPYCYESINRNAILIRPRKPFYDWLNNTFKDDEPIWEADENNIYLIREMISNEDVKKWIKKNFDGLFINELSDWCRDQSDFPKKRTYKLFCDWFEVEVHSLVFDLEEFPVTKR